MSSTSSGREHSRAAWARAIGRCRSTSSRNATGSSARANRTRSPSETSTPVSVRQHRPGYPAQVVSRDDPADGSTVRVIELTGKSGDVVLTHPWVLHSWAPDTSSYRG